IQLDHPQVSARHAVLRKSGSGHLLIDRNSTNHTYVNGRSITRTLLKRGDEIHIGPFQYIYQGGLLQPITSNQVIDIKAFQLKRTVMKDGKHVPLLNDISLAIPACSFVALVGASGAGKSTLMDALNGVRPVDGKVYYDGKDYYASFEAFRAQIGYVPQDDIVHRELTVERALSYAARLRLPDDFSSMQIRQRVNEVLHDVEMYEHRSKLITKLSGGQRKRVSIALELLAKPSVFFLDEPTSGLDPGLDRKLMKLLRNLARKGQTIVLVTHATANIMECDYVCFLSEGSMVYFGPPEKATRFFKVKDEDFTDIYIQLEEAKRNKRTPEQVNKFRTSSDYREYVEKLLGRNTVVAMPQPGQQKTKTRPRGNPWRQFGLLSLRYLELLIKDWKNLLILALQAPIIALILFVLIKYGIGTGGFDPANVVQCPTTAQVMTTSQNVLYPAISDPTHPIVSKSCSVVQHYLATAPTGQKYVQGRGDNTKALQDFIVPGPGDATTILFIMAFAAIMFGCINAAREIVKELSIYRRERMVCIGISPYIFSKMLVMGLLCLFQCAVLVFAVNLVDPFHKGILLPGALEVYITLSLTSLAGLMMGLALSAFVSNNDRAMSFVPILLIPQVIFSGTLFPLKEGFLQWLGALFPVRWAMAALGSSVGLHSDKLGGDTLFGTIETYHGTLFSTYTQREATTFLLLMWLALVAIIVIFGIITALLMKWKDRRR
ncbi:MAG TPA: ATP-binding cassette domain-containing protein, partial [Ktedonobacteraceae bacterium]|nr:ATP-binding cassette domain-containing protein [Ktedonobacteraceae bacterium]